MYPYAYTQANHVKVNKNKFDKYEKDKTCMKNITDILSHL